MTEASYIPLTAEALEDIKEYIKKVIAYAEYRSGETWWKHYRTAASLSM